MTQLQHETVDVESKESIEEMYVVLIQKRQVNDKLIRSIYILIA